MDIPGLAEVYASVNRVLVRNGRFVLSVITGVAEPRLPPGEYANPAHQLNSRVGQVFVMAAEKI
jgi:hypothetical protein